MWQALVNGVASILVLCYDLTVSLGIPSYALAIVMLTLFIKIITYPLTYKQTHSMRSMQELQPKIKALQEKYRKNPEKLNQATMELYKDNKVNPMAGCFPLLIQMPILIALFQALQKFQYNDIGSAFLWIPHLKDPDPTYIVPLLVAVTTFLQTKFTTPNTNVEGQAAMTQKMMLYTMPIFIGYISIKFPAGLGIYWIFFSIFGTLQMLYIYRHPTMKKGEVGRK